jgi:hypothetical protein
MVKVLDSDNLGNTFAGMVAAGFPSVAKNYRNLKVNVLDQYESFGTIKVCGMPWDWKRVKDGIIFTQPT